MVEREDVGSWLEGPGARTGRPDFPGQRLGLPRTGPGSAGRLGRRFAALTIDWAMCLVIAWGLLGVPLAGAGERGLLVNVVLFLENLLLVPSLGATFGQRLLGLRVGRPTGEGLGVLAAGVRAALLALGLPALIMNADQRGLHDLAAGSIVLRGAGPR